MARDVSAAVDPHDDRKRAVESAGSLGIVSRLWHRHVEHQAVLRLTLYRPRRGSSRTAEAALDECLDDERDRVLKPRSAALDAGPRRRAIINGPVDGQEGDGIPEAQLPEGRLGVGDVVEAVVPSRGLFGRSAGTLADACGTTHIQLCSMHRLAEVYDGKTLGRGANCTSRQKQIVEECDWHVFWYDHRWSRGRSDVSTRESVMTLYCSQSPTSLISLLLRTRPARVSLTMASG